MARGFGHTGTDIHAIISARHCWGGHGKHLRLPSLVWSRTCSSIPPPIQPNQEFEKGSWETQRSELGPGVMIFFFAQRFYFSPQNALFRHSQFSTLFFSMKMAVSRKIV